MIKSECSKKDCFFRVGDMCCNLCAPGNDSCNLYWVAASDKRDDADCDGKADRQPVADGEFSAALN